MTLSQWSLDKIQFLLSHMEDFVQEEKKQPTEPQTFEVQTGLDKLESLAGHPSHPNLPCHVFEKLSPFYEAGALLQKVGDQWLLSDLFWHGQVFHLEKDAMVDAGHVVREISPLQVEHAQARPVLDKLHLSFMPVPASAECFLFRPASQTAYLLISDLPEIWAADHVSATQRLLNNSFIY